MDEICRLCCSSNFVNNHIFDEENALYLKMSLYLPIKVFKNDRLPQKVCDKCSCKVNDIYQFCNETIEVQNRLRAVLISTAVVVEDSVDLTLIKENNLSPLPASNSMLGLDTNIVHKTEPNLDHSTDHVEHKKENGPKLQPFPVRNPGVSVGIQTDNNIPEHENEPEPEPVSSEINIDVPLYKNIKIKEEPQQPVKIEDLFPPDNYYNIPEPSDDDDRDDNVSLANYTKKKKNKKTANGNVEKKKRKPKIKEWEALMRALPGDAALDRVKSEPAEGDGADDESPMKTEPEEFHCCMCFIQCYSKAEMLQHYKEHARDSEDWASAPPAAPPPPDADPLKCPRCQKRLERAAWSSHWLRHWERDRRPYRCALCEKSFRDHQQILKHGLSHRDEGGRVGPGGPGLTDAKRYVCDLCPEGFVYMRYLLAHRTRSHPEAAGRALALRCAVCGRTFAHLNSLRRHLAAHSGERNFLCNVCGKALSSREHLKFHIRIHTGYKPNVCKTCGKGFVKKCNLTLHERVHSGEKPHVCSHCGKAFSQRSTLVIHERYHSGARPYVCGLCGRGFVAKGLLSMHLKTTCI